MSLSRPTFVFGELPCEVLCVVLRQMNMRQLCLLSHYSATFRGFILGMRLLNRLNLAAERPSANLIRIIAHAMDLALWDLPQNRICIQHIQLHPDANEEYVQTALSLFPNVISIDMTDCTEAAFHAIIPFCGWRIRRIQATWFFRKNPRAPTIKQLQDIKTKYPTFHHFAEHKD